MKETEKYSFRQIEDQSFQQLKNQHNYYVKIMERERTCFTVTGSEKIYEGIEQ